MSIVPKKEDLVNEAVEALKEDEKKDPERFGKVILPMIRRIMPGTIAQDLVGVQPMQGPAGQIFTLRQPKRGQLRPTGGVDPVFEVFDGEEWIRGDTVEARRILREVELQ